MTWRQRVSSMASTIIAVSVYDEQGKVTLPYVERLAELEGTDTDTADSLIGDALELLCDEGELLYEDGDYYRTVDYEEWKELDDEERNEWKDAQHDMLASYNINIWG